MKPAEKARNIIEKTSRLSETLVIYIIEMLLREEQRNKRNTYR